ncbi:hypothetical protein H5P35_01975 [Mycobacterium haemophilum DSM 44634]|nr:hypothetical protein [Mycobacterium haemophilum DSM 44634]
MCDRFTVRPITHWLPGDAGGKVEMLVQMQDGQPAEFRGRGDDQVRH